MVHSAASSNTVCGGQETAQEATQQAAQEAANVRLCLDPTITLE
jgi:hypothetical protein